MLAHTWTPSPLRLLPALMGLTLLVGCDLDNKSIGEFEAGDEQGDEQGGDALVNPSGDCVAEGDGTRPCYDGHDPETTYMPLCDNPRERELWRIFAVSEDLAYMLPRPDATGLDFGICDGDDPELAALFESKGLCSAIASSADIELINSMTLEEAMRVSSALHERLSFTTDNPDWGVFPWSPLSDVRDACELYPETFAGFESTCQQLTNHFDSAPDCDLIGFEFTDEENEVFAAGLNLLYGVE